MAEKVEISVIANDLASAALDLIKNKLMAVGGTTAMVGTAALTAGAAVVVGLSKAKDAAQAYDQQVYELMLRTGGTAEETSRLIQVVDDAGVSYGTLETAMKFAVKNGIEPNIQSLASLSDEYMSLNGDVERGQFLLDKFGRSGMDMVRVMNLGGDAIREMNSQVEAGLVVTDKAIRESEEYRKNVDQLNDSWEGFKVTVGNKVIPAINDSLDAIKRHNSAMTEAEQITGTADRRTNMYVATMILEKQNLDKVAQASIFHGDSLEGMTGQIEGATTATDGLVTSTEDLAKAQQATLDQNITMAMDVKEYTADLEELNEQYDIELDKLKDLESKYPATSELVKDQKNKVGDLKGQVDALTTSQKAQMDGWVLAMMKEKGATVDMQLAYALASGMIDQKSYDMITAVSQVTDQFINNRDEVNEGKHAIKEFIDKVALLNGSEAYVDVYIQTHGSMPPAPTTTTCFIAGTLVTMADGDDKPIESVIIGDAVTSYDTDSGEFVTAKIVDVFYHEAKEIDGYWMINEVGVTPEHLMYVNGAWLPAEDIIIGDSLVYLDGTNQTVTSKHWIEKRVKTFNLHTNHKTHNYFADGVLVHNGKRAEGGPVTRGESYLVGEKGMEIFTPNQSGYIIPNDEINNSVPNPNIYRDGTRTRGMEKAGDVFQVYLTYAPMISGFDKSEITTKLLPFIREGLRRIKIGG